MAHVEWIGYTASVLIVISMMMSSIIKLRIINMLGAAAFSAYGFIIGAVPVGLLNGIVVLVNLYHLYRYLRRSDDFRMLEINPKGEYLANFAGYFEDDIRRYFPAFTVDGPEDRKAFLVLRNMDVAGVFLGHEKEGEFVVELDYAVPRYRDLEPGKFVYQKNAAFFRTQGVDRFITQTTNKTHRKYLAKMGFEPMVSQRASFEKPIWQGR